MHGQLNESLNLKANTINLLSLGIAITSRMSKYLGTAL